jgi:acyl-CoA thioesterase
MDEGAATFALTVRPDHRNPYGAVHGGVIYSLVDTAMGAALVTRLEPGERCATLEIKIHYLAAVTTGEIRAEARVVERGRRVSVLEARVFDDGDRLVALATGSFYIHG